MHEIKDSETVPYTVRQMFELVADVEHYKEFLPWCTDSRIVRREKKHVVVAEIQLGYGPLHTTFATRNTYRTNRAIEMDLVDGPFEVLEGSWQFEPLPRDGCRMSLDLQFEFAQHHLEEMFNHMFKRAMETLAHAFTDRAKDLYGK
jgi:ribosome-associated toxin RatA of RatAB toxin-antitoxin module